jgi:lysophospholipase L1-like esterase
MLSPFAADAAPKCLAPTNLIHFTAPLPAFAAALEKNEPVRILALGSSSTQGIGASSPKATYPVKLQAELRRRFPDSQITVVNLGVGGQLATDMLARMKRQVIAKKPTLVFWQTGVNDAIRHVDLAQFRKTVTSGIQLLQKYGIDVVLIDMQYFPRAEKIRDFARYLVAMRQIAEAAKVPIMQRFAIMKHLVTSAQFTPRELLASDLFHPNDLSYGCLGRMLADALQGEVIDSRRTVKLPAAPRARQADAAAGSPLPAAVRPAAATVSN